MLFVSKFKIALFFLLAGFLITSCSKSESARQSANSQYTADSQAKADDLKVAEGEYTGVMHMINSNQDFVVNLHLKVVLETEKSPEAQNPAETVTVPRLSGSLNFPALDNAGIKDFSNFSEIVGPMGGFAKILFDYGDYNPANQSLLLPYSVAGYSDGKFGDLQGQLAGNKLTGTWFSKPFGDVGQFKLEKQTRSETQP